MREPNLTTSECFTALELGFILENEHGYKVYLKRGKQFITNKRRLHYRGKDYAYKFDYPTWQIVGKLPLKERIINKLYLWCAKSIPKPLLRCLEIKQRSKYVV